MIDIYIHIDRHNKKYKSCDCGARPRIGHDLNRPLFSGHNPTVVHLPRFTHVLPSLGFVVKRANILAVCSAQHESLALS